MFQAGYDLGLKFKTADEIGLVGILWQDDLDGHLAPHLRLEGAVDGSKTAGADLLVQAVAAEDGGCFGRPKDRPRADPLVKILGRPGRLYAKLAPEQLAAGFVLGQGFAPPATFGQQLHHLAVSGLHQRIQLEQAGGVRNPFRIVAFP